MQSKPQRVMACWRFHHDPEFFIHMHVLQNCSCYSYVSSLSSLWHELLSVAGDIPVEIWCLVHRIVSKKLSQSVLFQEPSLGIPRRTFHGSSCFTSSVALTQLKEVKWLWVHFLLYGLSWKFSWLDYVNSICFAPIANSVAVPTLPISDL